LFRNGEGIIDLDTEVPDSAADSTAFSIAIAHAQRAIEKQREALRQGRTGSMPQQESEDKTKRKK